MKIVTRAHSSIPKKVLRRIKYKLYRLRDKFQKLLGANIYIAIEGSRLHTYTLKVVYSVAGPDVIISCKGKSIDALIESCMKRSHRLLAELA